MPVKQIKTYFTNSYLIAKTNSSEKSLIDRKYFYTALLLSDPSRKPSKSPAPGSQFLWWAWSAYAASSRCRTDIPRWRKLSKQCKVSGAVSPAVRCHVSAQFLLTSIVYISKNN